MGELGPRTVAGSNPEARPLCGIAKEQLERRAQRRWITRRHEHDAVARQVDEPATPAGHERASVCHCLARREAVALPARRRTDNRRPFVIRAEPGWRRKPEGLRSTRSERTVPDHHPRHPFGCREEFEDSLLLAQPPRIEDVWRLGGLGRMLG